jgi:hypothetical protein
MERLARAPRLLPAGCRASLTAWRPPAGHWGPRPRRPASGSAPPPGWRPLPKRRAAPVVTPRRRQRNVAGTPRGGCGPHAAGEHGWAPGGGRRTPACGARRHRRLRQRVAALRRRRATSGQGADGEGQHLGRGPGSHHCGWPPASLRPARAAPLPPPGPGAAQGGRRGTPARATGWPEPVGARPEGRLVRGLPWPPPRTGEAAVPVAAQGVEPRPGAQRSARRLGRGGKTGVEGGEPADGHDADGAREVPKHSPQG